MEQFIIVYFIKLFFQGIIIIIGLFAATFIDSRYIIGTYNSERIVFVKVIFFILLIYGLEVIFYYYYYYINKIDIKRKYIYIYIFFFMKIDY